MKKNSLSLKIIVRIGLLVVLICVIQTLFSVNLLNGIQSRQVVNGMTKTRDDAGKLIELSIDAYIREVSAVAQRSDIRSMNWEIQRPVLISEAKRIGFESFEVGNVNGMAHSTEGDDVWVGGRAYYSAALAGRSTISDIVYDERHKKMVVMVSSPLYNDRGVVEGVLSAVADASFTNQIISSIDLDYDGFMFVINDSGDKMAGVNYKNKTELENNIHDPRYAPDGKYGQFRKAQLQMIQQESGVETFEMDGKSYYLSFVTINGGEWHLGIIQDKSQALAILNVIVIRMSLITILFIVLGCLSGVILSRSLLPLRDVSRNINQIASGKADLTQRISVKADYEIGELVDGFNLFTQKLQTIITVMKDSKNSLFDVGTLLKQNTKNTQESITAILEHIRSTQNGTSLQFESVDQTATAVHEISSNIESLEHMVENQSESVKIASDAVSAMIRNIEKVNNSVEKMADSFVQLEEKAQNGVQKQDDMSKKIEIVGEQSQMLENANKTIQAIASQTNLLAMNAAIEAAHAGEAGKGFSVVADEIRKLSENSTAQSKVIGTQLGNIQESIKEIIVASDESRIAFKEVSDEIQSTDYIVREISAAMEEQHEDSERINESLGSMNNSTSVVLSAVNEMSEGNASILKEIQNLQNSTMDLKQNMEEMQNGAEAIKQTGISLTEISDKMSDSINEIGGQVDQFNV